MLLSRFVTGRTAHRWNWHGWFHLTSAFTTQLSRWSVQRSGYETNETKFYEFGNQGVYWHLRKCK